MRVSRSQVTYRDDRGREKRRGHDRGLGKCSERFWKHPHMNRVRKVLENPGHTPAVTMREELEQLRGELAALRAAMVAEPVWGARVDVPKPKPFAGSRSAKDVDNFVWGMEQYFRVATIANDAKVSTAALYLSDVALLW